MSTYLIPFIKKEEFLDLFDLLEDYAYRIVETYLKEHSWDDEVARLNESRFIGVGTCRLLINIYVRHLDSSFEELINFYEKCQRPKDDPITKI